MADACAKHVLRTLAAIVMPAIVMPFLVAATAMGGEPGAGTPENRAAAHGWSIYATPYGWLPFLKGDVTIAGRTANIDINPIEVLEHLERVPWMSYVEARKGPLAFYNDIFYANLGASVGAATTFGRVGTASATLGLDFEELVIELGGAYEVARWSHGGGATALDVLAGARYWHQDMSLNLALSAGLNIDGLEIVGNRAVASAGSVDWVDPVVGARIRHRLAPGQELLLRGDVGGFGAGSKFSWNAVAAYSWVVTVRDGVVYSGLLGYRALDVDYEEGSGLDRYVYDVLQHGPVTGLTVRY